MVGSVVPSSKFLSKKMLDHLNFKKAKLVVELGPGTGVFTQRIIEKLDRESTLLVIELLKGNTRHDSWFTYIVT